MAKKYRLRLFREFVEFARENRIYWLIPLVVILVATGVLIVTGQAAAPLLYTLF